MDNISLDNISKDLTPNAGLRDYIRNAMQCRPFVFFMVKMDIILRYRRSYLGILWHIIVPVSQVAVISLVFHSLMRKTGGIHYVIFLVPGIVMWNFISQSLRESALSILEVARLLRAASVPVVIFPLVKTLSSVTVLLLIFPLFAVIVRITGVTPGISPLLVLWGITIVLISVIGVSIICAIINVFFRDFSQLLEILILIGFFATPIIYSEDQLPPIIRSLVHLNPLTYLINIVREPLIGTLSPDFSVYITCSLLALLCLACGIAVGYLAQQRIAYAVE